MLSLHTISLRKKGTTPSDPRDDGDHLEPLNAFLPDNLSLVFWAMLASRYSKNPAVLYDLLNEPHERSRDAQFDAYYPEEIKTSDAASFADRWHVWVLRLSSTIRKIHPRALIFVSGSANNDGWASSLQYMPVYEGSAPIKNTVYSFHWYGSRKLDDIKGWTEFLTVDSGRSGPAKNLKTVNSAVPVFAGEWGASSADSIRADVTQACVFPPNAQAYYKAALAALDSSLIPRTDPKWAAWADALIQFFADQASKGPDGKWKGLAGFTAWSYLGVPTIVKTYRAECSDPNNLTALRDCDSDAKPQRDAAEQRLMNEAQAAGQPYAPLNCGQAPELSLNGQKIKEAIGKFKQLRP